MAYWPDTGTGVDTQPARKPVQSAIRKYFTEGGIGQAPTVPGGDWFNQMTNEVLNVLEAAGIEPSKVSDNQLLLSIQYLADYASSSLRSELQSEAGAGMIGTPAGDLYDYFAAKDFTFPIRNIYPTMTVAEINALLATKGGFYFNAGQYSVASSIFPSENSSIHFDQACLLKPAADGVTVIDMTNATPGTAYLRNCHLHSPRISLDGKNNCQAIRANKTRNHSSINTPWIDMVLGSNNIGIRVEFLSYGLILNDPEVLNGGVGSTRIMIRNGSNAVELKNPRSYSADPNGVKPDYGIVVFNGLDGSYAVDNVNTFVTASVNIIGGFSQDTNLFGLFDQSVSCNVQGTYFENNMSSDVSLGTGSYYFNSDNTHHSKTVGGSCYRGRGANYARIGNFNPVARSVGVFDFTAGNTQCVADLATFTPGMVIGVTDGLRVSLGKGSVKQYTLAELPINVNQGFETYRINLTAAPGGVYVVTVSGTPYDGQRIRCLFRGDNISSLTFAGIPVDVTGANTATTKTAIVEATYWSAISKWTLTMPQWTA